MEETRGLLELLTQRRSACSHSLLLLQLTFSHPTPPESPTILSPQTHREALDPCYAACSCLQYKQTELQAEGLEQSGRGIPPSRELGGLGPQVPTRGKEGRKAAGTGTQPLAWNRETLQKGS